MENIVLLYELLREIDFKFEDMHTIYKNTDSLKKAPQFRLILQKFIYILREIVDIEINGFYRIFEYYISNNNFDLKKKIKIKIIHLDTTKYISIKYDNDFNFIGEYLTIVNKSCMCFQDLYKRIDHHIHELNILLLILSAHHKIHYTNRLPHEIYDLIYQEYIC